MRMRIATLLPSATEIICGLGLESNLVAVSHECDYPPSVSQLPRVTSALVPAQANSSEIDAWVRDQSAANAALYALDTERLVTLAPDLIVTQTLCDVCAVSTSQVSEAVSRIDPSPQLLDLNAKSLDGVVGSIMKVGEATEAMDAARKLIESLQRRMDTVRSESARRPVQRIAFLEWLMPPFSAGHWNPTLVQLAGGIDVLATAGDKSRQISWDDIAAADPDRIVVACCGYDVASSQRDIEALAQNTTWSTMRAVRDGRVIVLDGNQYFNRPGPRLVDGLELLAEALCGNHNS